jgi:glycosyltransferase involved in cell wall biosynthesis
LKPFVYRIDGPISGYRNSKKRTIDRLIYDVCKRIADATIFQSDFSRNENFRLGLIPTNIEKTIHNASNKEIFNSDGCRTGPIPNKRKIKLISVSWSSNIMKGFDTYSYLDANLDFTRYKYTFVGNTPVKFQNIAVIPPLPSKELAQILKSSDIYITASQKDPCSNSLIEALSCGLPAVALRDGGHPELIRGGGETFQSASEIPSLLEKLCSNYTDYLVRIPEFSIEEVTDKYLDVFKKTIGVSTKKISLYQLIFLSFRCIICRI